MLNGPGEEVAVPPAAEQTEKTDVSPLQQLLLISVAVLYLFGIVWLYVKFPWVALGAVLFAGAVVITGFLTRSARQDEEPAP